MIKFQDDDKRAFIKLVELTWNDPMVNAVTVDSVCTFYASCGTSYWVGKNSLKKWRWMAEEALHLTSVLPKENGEQENDDDHGYIFIWF